MPLHKFTRETHGGMTEGFSHDRAGVPIFLKKHLSAFVRFPESATPGVQVKIEVPQHRDQKMPRVASNRPPARMARIEGRSCNPPTDGKDTVEREVGSDWTRTVELGPLIGWAPRQSGGAEIALL